MGNRSFSRFSIAASIAVTAADDLEGYGEQVQEWDDYDETEDRAFSSGKKKKKSKKKNKHLYGDFD